MARLLMTADAVGGVWTYALELARALAHRRLFTTLATMGPPPSEDQLAAAADVPGLEIASEPFQLEWMPEPWADVAAAGKWLLALEAQVRPAIVHLNGYAYAALPWRAPVVVVGHSCVLSWAEAVDDAMDPRRLERYRMVAARGLRAAGCVVTPSAAMLEGLQRHYGPLPRTGVVPNGRTAARFQPAPKEPLILAAGRLWDPAKNISAVCRAADGLPWPVVVAGDLGGSARERMDIDHVCCLGRVSEDDVAAWLGRASIFVHPARYEPFGLLPLEAALAGCALVLGDLASLREVWADTAVFVDPLDRDALRDAIRGLIANPDRRMGLARRARERALSYTPDRMADGYMRIYDAQHAAAGVPLRAVS